MECENNTFLTEFDRCTLPDYLQLFKAVLPYLPFSFQSKFALYIRFTEFTSTLQYYQKPLRMQMMSAGTGNTASQPEDLLESLLQYCPPAMKPDLQNMQQMMKFSNIMKNLNPEDIAGFGDLSGFGNLAGFGDLSGFKDFDGSGDSSSSTTDTPAASGLFSSAAGMMDDEQNALYNEYLSQMEHFTFPESQTDSL